MAMLLKIVLFSCLIFTVSAGTFDSLWDMYSRGEFSFDDSADSKNGPSHWKEKFPMCGGKNQSPINIDTKKVQCNNKLKDFVYHGYDSTPKTPFTVYAFEGAQIVIFEVNENITITNDWLNSSYSMFVMAFEGYGNTIDEEPTELNILFGSTSNKYGRAKALFQSDGIVALQVRVKAGDSTKIKFDPRVDLAFKELIAAAGQSTFTPKFPLENLLPRNRIYYKYQGSYLVPPCPESATFSVFQEPIYVEGARIRAFFRVYNKQVLKRKNFGRPLQPLNGRIVETLCDP